MKHFTSHVIIKGTVNQKMEFIFNIDYAVETSSLFQGEFRSSKTPSGKACHVVVILFLYEVTTIVCQFGQLLPCVLQTRRCANCV